MEDRDLTRAKQAIVVTSVIVFVCWEVFKHLFLMNVPMMVSHLVSGFVEATGALALCALAVRLLGLVAAAKTEQRNLGRIVGVALGTSVTLATALRDIQSVADTLRAQPPPEPPVLARQGEVLSRHVRDLQRALNALTGLSRTATERGTRPGGHLPCADPATLATIACSNHFAEAGESGPAAPEATEQPRPGAQESDSQRPPATDGGEPTLAVRHP